MLPESRILSVPVTVLGPLTVVIPEGILSLSYRLIRLPSASLLFSIIWPISERIMKSYGRFCSLRPFNWLEEIRIDPSWAIRASHFVKKALFLLVLSECWTPTFCSKSFMSSVNERNSSQLFSEIILTMVLITSSWFSQKINLPPDFVKLSANLSSRGNSGSF